jgi:hypothetical protein
VRARVRARARVRVRSTLGLGLNRVGRAQRLACGRIAGYCEGQGVVLVGAVGARAGARRTPAEEAWTALTLSLTLTLALALALTLGGEPAEAA